MELEQVINECTTRRDIERHCEKFLIKQCKKNLIMFSLFGGIIARESFRILLRYNPKIKSEIFGEKNIEEILCDMNKFGNNTKKFLLKI